MIASLYALAAVALVLVVLRARAYVVLCLFATATLVVPAPLAVPYTHSNFLTFQHVLALAGLARLVLGRIDGSVTRRQLTPVAPQVALLALVLVGFFGGIFFAADAGPLGFASYRFVDLLDQLVWLSVLVVLARQVGARATLSAAAVGLTFGLGIATVEHFTSASWGRLLFTPFPEGNHLSTAGPLELRDGQHRVRAGVEYALDFGWIVVVLAPALMVTVLRRWGAWAAAAAGGACVLAVYWSYARSALPAAVIVVVLTALLSGRRPFAIVAAAALVPCAVVASLVPSIQAHLSVATDAGSVAVRSQRVAPAMAVASLHPYRGAGLGRIVTSGFQATDEAFLLEYVELGVLGVVALGLVLVATLALCSRAAVKASITERPLAVASLLGALAYVGSCFAYDAATLLQSTHALWLVVAAAAALVPPWRAGVVPWRLVPRVVAAGMAGFLVGLVVFTLAPEHTAQRAFFTTLPPATETIYPLDPVTAAGPLLGTVCGVVRSTHIDGVRVDCTDSFGAAGVGQWRVQARTPFLLDQAVHQLVGTVRDQAGVRYFNVAPLEEPRTGRDTWARTAPVWCGVAAAGLVALLWPRRKAGSTDADQELAPSPRRIEIPVGAGS